MSKDLPPLEVANLSKHFDKVEAVQSVSFTVQAGEVLGIVGPNGAGKSTTIKCILGLLEPNAGRISLFGEHGITQSVQQRIGYMPETPSFYNHLTGRELLHFAGELFRIPNAQARKRATDLLSMVSLKKAADRQLHGYSKGMLQRICLAQALMNEPELLFLDEPMDGLDPIGRIEMKEILLEVRERGTAIVFNSHILSDVAAISDSIAIMHNGRIIKHGPTTKLIPSGKTLEDIFIATIGKEEAV